MNSLVWGATVRLLEWWSIPRKAWILILAELCVIVGLSSWVVSEYLSNIYFQNYVNSLAPTLVPVVSVGFGVASASTATILYFRMKNLSHVEQETMEEDARPRGQRRAARRIAPSDSVTVRSVPGSQSQASKLRPLMPGGSSPSRNTTTAGSDEKKESSQSA
jgi:hypothetical protein